MKNKLLPSLAVLLGIVISSSAIAAPMAPIFPSSCILKLVADKMSIQLSSSTPAPEIRLASQASLKDFQDAVEKQWGFRPSAFTNVYVISRNEIYLVDDEKFYLPLGRAVDDSIAHELAHFIQVRYRGANLDEDGDSLEREAVRVQTWFRDEIFKKTDPKEACR